MDPSCHYFQTFAKRALNNNAAYFSKGHPFGLFFPRYNTLTNVIFFQGLFLDPLTFAASQKKRSGGIAEFGIQSVQINKP
jgi:hypothetical protein